MSSQPAATANSRTVPSRAVAAVAGQAPGLLNFFVDGNALILLFEVEREIEPGIEPWKERDVGVMTAGLLPKAHWILTSIKAERLLRLLPREVVGLSEWDNFSATSDPTETNKKVHLVSASAAVLEPKLREVEGVVSSWAWMDEEELVLRLYTLVDRLDYDLETRVFAAYRFVKEKLRGLVSVECRVIPVQTAVAAELVPDLAQRII